LFVAELCRALSLLQDGNSQFISEYLTLSTVVKSFKASEKVSKIDIDCVGDSGAEIK